MGRTAKYTWEFDVINRPKLDLTGHTDVYMLPGGDNKPTLVGSIFKKRGANTYPAFVAGVYLDDFDTRIDAAKAMCEAYVAVCGEPETEVEADTTEAEAEAETEAEEIPVKVVSLGDAASLLGISNGQLIMGIQDGEIETKMVKMVVVTDEQLIDAAARREAAESVEEDLDGEAA